MKKSIFFLCAFFVQGGFMQLTAQEGNTIQFTYDGSGALTQRKLQVMVQGRLANKNSLGDTVQLAPAPNFKIYPNPTNTYLNIEGNLPEGLSNAQVLLLDVEGKALKKDSYTGEAKSISVSDLKAGMYLLEFIYTEKKKSTYKIVVTN